MLLWCLIVYGVAGLLTWRKKVQTSWENYLATKERGFGSAAKFDDFIANVLFGWTFYGILWPVFAVSVLSSRYSGDPVALFVGKSKERKKKERLSP